MHTTSTIIITIAVAVTTAAAPFLSAWSGAGVLPGGWRATPGLATIIENTEEKLQQEAVQN
jgi:hypothetical protein